MRCLSRGVRHFGKLILIAAWTVVWKTARLEAARKVKQDF